MKPIRRTLTVAGSCIAFMMAPLAHAHYVWLEASATDSKLYFGEADALLKEKGPGKLDTIKAPRAFVQKAGNTLETVPVERSPGFYRISAGSKEQAILVAEESVEVKDLSRSGLGFAKSNYYARYGQTGNASTSPLKLDIQQRSPDTFVVLYQGQALKNAKLEVIAPNTWLQEHTTDAHGEVKINTPWRGRYILHLLHVDKTAGEFEGRKYDALRNHLTYTLVRNHGANPGPALPPQPVMD